MVEKKGASSKKGVKKAAPKKGTAKKGASSTKRTSKKASTAKSNSEETSNQQDIEQVEVENTNKRQHKGKRTETKNYVARATLRNVRISPRKARLVVNLIKGKQIEPALQILAFSSKKGAALTEKLLRSAIQSAVENASADADRLWITGAWVNMGRTMKRYMPRAQGRATPIRKRSAHITVQLSER